MNLNQVTVPSLDLNKSIPFYEMLGLKLIIESLPNYARFICPDGDATFSISKVDKIPASSNITIYFECDDLDEYVKQLQRKKITFTELPNDKRWLWREARLNDLDGNKLVLFNAGVNRKNPPWRIND